MVFRQRAIIASLLAGLPLNHPLVSVLFITGHLSPLKMFLPSPGALPGFSDFCLQPGLRGSAAIRKIAPFVTMPSSFSLQASLKRDLFAVVLEMFVVCNVARRFEKLCEPRFALFEGLLCPIEAVQFH